ncbi:MAG: DUF3122 domain-containing protein [Cyanobacteria bacterium J06621_11]
MIHRCSVWRFSPNLLESVIQRFGPPFAKQWLAFGLLLSFSICFAPQPAIAQSVVSFSTFSVTTPVASLHTYQEKPGQTTFRSKQSLRDRSDRSWQVIVFKRYQGDALQGLYLRLVGFPGLVAVDDEKPLAIATGSSLQWQAPPELDPQTPELPENAAQYNIAETLNALEGDIPLQVDIPLSGDSIAKLVVPPFAVKEWRELAASQA